MSVRLEGDPRLTTQVSRRDLLQYAGATALALGLGTELAMKTTQTAPERLSFSPSQLGVNIHLAGIRHFQLDVKKTVDDLFRLPIDHVRIPLPFDEIFIKEHGNPDFSTRDQLIEKALKDGKTIHLQMGAKTIGYPEVHLPFWLVDRYGENLKPDGVQIDKNPYVAEQILQWLELCAERYLPHIEGGSVHVENEPFSEHLKVSRDRFISQAFNKRELEIVRSADPHKNTRSYIQNLPIHPLDYLKARDFVFENYDTVGLNIYPQYNETRFPNPVAERLLWAVISYITNDSRSHGMDVSVTEQQVAKWISSNYPFEEEKAETDIHKTQQIVKPKIMMLWDAEQTVRNRDHGDSRQFDALLALAQAA